MSEQKGSFEEWYSAVDAQLMEALGISAMDLPSQPWFEWYARGYDPETIVTNVVLWCNAPNAPALA